MGINLHFGLRQRGSRFFVPVHVEKFYVEFFYVQGVEELAFGRSELEVGLPVVEGGLGRGGLGWFGLAGGEGREKGNNQD